MPGSDEFGHPTMHLPRLRDAAHAKYDDLLYASGPPME
jgi:hypothetical protein